MNYETSVTLICAIWLESRIKDIDKSGGQIGRTIVRTIGRTLGENNCEDKSGGQIGRTHARMNARTVLSK